MDYNLEISGMTCDACSKSITLKLKKLTAVQEVNIDSKAGTGKITTLGTHEDISNMIREVIKSLGFKLTKISKINSS